MDFVNEYAERFLGRIFYYSVKKTGDENEAADLAGEIGYEVLLSLSRGCCPVDFERWVWAVAANTYKKWAKKRYYAPDSDYVELDEVSGGLVSDVNLEDEFVLSEDMARLRRELAFIRSDYRRILIAHYFEGKSVYAIADEFSLPVGTVKTKLQNSRKMLKEGMDMAREFGRRAYRPENMRWVSNTFRSGGNGQPWSIVTHMLYKNIFLEVYGNPKTAEELSLEMGISLPYMEAELEFLVEQTLLIKKDGRYGDNFPIISAGAQVKIAEAARGVERELTSLLEGYVDGILGECERDGVDLYGGYVSRDVAKWTLLMYYFDKFERANAAVCRYEYRERPDNGKWEIEGYEVADTARPDFVGLHGHGGAVGGMHFLTYRFQKYGMCDLTPDFCRDEAVAMIRYLGKNRLDEDGLDKMVEYGYMKKSGGEYVPNVVILRDYAGVGGDEKLREAAGKINKIMEEHFLQGRDVIISDLPSDIAAIEGAVNMAIDGCCGIERGHILDAALSDGWLVYDEKYAKIYGAYIEIYE